MKTLIQCVYIYIPIPRIIPSNIPGQVVLCLSVTKWVHFAHGDTGLHNLFKRCFKRTRLWGSWGILGDPGDNIPHTVGMA